jgi:UDP-N-acetylmuramate dehydrogenase
MAMIKIDEHVGLKSYNTFGIDATARYFCQITSEDQFKSLLQTDLYKNEKVLILGGGSNILFTKDFDGLVVKTDIKGIHIVDENDETVSIKAMSGEIWHELVVHCVNHQWGGIQNLSLIPGTTGAAPIQNIGAYGVEVKEVVKEVTGIDRINGDEKTFQNNECAFGYRESIFKHQLKEKFFISSVTLSLTKKNHIINTNYGAIKDTLKEMNIIEPTLKSISDAVIHIRKSKLPDPTHVGNAGSFFKNPTISLLHYQSLQKLYINIPGYHSVNQEVKVPAGWLIEQCGWKGKRLNDIGVHAQQALVLVNYGNGNGKEIFQLAMNIISSVKEKFNIILSPEVNII